MERTEEREEGKEREEGGEYSWGRGRLVFYWIREGRASWGRAEQCLWGQESPGKVPCKRMTFHHGKGASCRTEGAYYIKGNNV